PDARSASAERDEIGRAIARARAARALGLQPLAQLADARAAARARTAATSDVFDRARTLVDDRVDIALRRGVAEADDHLNLIMHFKTRIVKVPNCGRKALDLLSSSHEVRSAPFWDHAKCGDRVDWRVPQTPRSRGRRTGEPPDRQRGQRASEGPA